MLGGLIPGKRCTLPPPPGNPRGYTHRSHPAQTALRGSRQWNVLWANSRPVSEATAVWDPSPSSAQFQMATKPLFVSPHAPLVSPRSLPYSRGRGGPPSRRTVMAPAASHFQPEITPIPDRLAPGPGISSTAAWVRPGVSSSTPRQRRSGRESSDPPQSRWWAAYRPHFAAADKGASSSPDPDAAADKGQCVTFCGAAAGRNSPIKSTREVHITAHYQT